MMHKDILCTHISNWKAPQSISSELAANDFFANLIEADEECFLFFWLKRPTRLFWILENYSQVPVETAFIDSEINRMKLLAPLWFYEHKQIDILLKNAAKYNEEDITKQIFFPRKPHNYEHTVYVPLILKDNSHTAVYFDSFMEFSTLSFTNLKKSATDRFLKLSSFFKEKYKDSDRNIIALPATIKQLSGLSVCGNSDQLGYWIYKWLKHNRVDIAPSLCCTGKINSDGSIVEIEDYELKLRAWQSKGFDFFLVPENNRKRQTEPNSRVIGFSNIEELEHWLLQNTGSAPRIRKVRSWLVNDRKIPDFCDFKAYFSENADSFQNPITIFKAATERQSETERYRKLAITVKKYEKYMSLNSAFHFYQFPDYISFALLPWLIDKVDCPHRFYQHISHKFTGAGHDAYLATRFLLNNSPEKLLTSNSFARLRKYYPLLLWLFFREPSEMLYVFSLLSDLNSYEQNCLSILLNELNDNAFEYANMKTSGRTDAMIMQTVINYIDNDAIFKPASVLSARKRLPLLYRSMVNFSTQKKQRFTDAATETCKKLMHAHLLNFDVEAEQVCQQIEKSMNNEKDFSVISEFKKNPSLYELGNEISKNKHGITDSDPKHYPDLLKDLSNNLRGTALNRSWLPHPGIVFIKNLSNSVFWIIKWKKLLDSFDKDNYKSPATALRRHCLTHFAGIIYACNSRQSSQNIAMNIGRQSSLPYFVAILNEFNSCIADTPDKCRLSDTLLTNKSSELFWYYLLPLHCKKCRLEQIKEIISEYESVVSNISEKIESKMAGISMLCSLPDKNSFANHAVKLKKHWHNSIKSFDDHPSKIRRTTTALKPIYDLLSSGSNAADVAQSSLELIRNEINNSQFAKEYIQTFILNKSNKDALYRKISWFHTLDEQIFNSLLIAYAKVKCPEVLPRILLNCVEDVPNISAALSE